MKNFIAFLILSTVIMIPISVRSEIIENIVVVEVNGKEIIKPSDLKMEEKFQEAGCLPPLLEGFRSKNSLESFIDETILASVGLEKIEKQLSSANRNFCFLVEKTDEWPPGEFADVLQIWSGHTDDFFKKIVLLGKIGEEDGKDLKKIIKDWKNLLLVNLFFPEESRFARRESVRKIIRITAEELNTNFSYVERRFLRRALAKRALVDLEEKIEHVFILPIEIKTYCEQHPLSLLEFQHLLVKTEGEAVAILEKLAANQDKINLGDLGGFTGMGADLESLIPEFREGILRVAEKNIEMGYVQTDMGYHVIQVKKTLFGEKCF